MVQRTAGRVDQHDAHGRGSRLEVARNPGQRAAGAGGGAERVDLALRVAPDFRPGALEVRITIGGIVELIGPDSVRQFESQAPGDLLVLIWIAVRDRRHLAQLRAQGLDDLVFFRRLIVRHDDHALVAARVADVRETDAGVSGRALDDGSARLKRAAALGIEHDPFGRPVLDRTAGVHEFRLAEDFTAGFLAQPV